MQITFKDIDTLIAYDKNARTHSIEQIDQIVSSITNYGFNAPIEIDSENVIISGHARVEAARKLGMRQVPTILHGHLDKTMQRGYTLAANKIALNSAWDNVLLRDELIELREDGLDLLTTGFDQEELDDLLLEDVILEGLVDEDDCPDLSPDPISKEGDLWLLGNHRLVCGNSTFEHHVALALGGQLPNTMITDPPYGVQYESDWRDYAKGRKNTDKKRTHAMTLKNDDIADWYEAYSLFSGNIMYIWHADKFSHIIREGIEKCDFQPKQQIIWSKNNHVLNSVDYHYKHEPCWFAVRNNYKKYWKGDRKQTTIWEVPMVSTKNREGHPTQKPVELYVMAIVNHTNPGEYIYDPFGGSGTLMVACEKTDRRAVMIELDPAYCDMIVQRYETFTGKKATRGN